MPQTELKVWSNDAKRWGIEWLEQHLSDTASRLKAGLKQREGDDQGDWRVYWLARSPGATHRVAREALSPQRVWIRESRGAVLVSELAPADWLGIQGDVDSRYQEDLRRQTQELSVNFTYWWAEVGRQRLLVRFVESDGRPWRIKTKGDDVYVEAPIAMPEVPKGADWYHFEQSAQNALTEVLERVSMHFHVELQY